jgi:ribosome maturation factor RimP
MGSVIPEKLAEFIQAEAEKDDYYLLDVMSRKGAGISLDITIDKQGGITLDECSDFNRKVSAWMEKSAVCGDFFTVDVSSPGLDRVLKTDADLKWANGKQIIVSTYDYVEGKKQFEGELAAYRDEDITIKLSSGDAIELKRKNIAKARLRVEI